MNLENLKLKTELTRKVETRAKRNSRTSVLQLCFVYARRQTRDKMTANEFSVADYIVFACMLLVSSAIGVYHAYGGKQSTTKEYLMAGKGMGCFPIFVSLLASYLSAITLLGVPSEIYTYGVQYCVLLLSYFILCTVAAVIYAPIFYRLDITSAHEVIILSHNPCFTFTMSFHEERSFCKV